jgi:hypothetical protein
MALTRRSILALGGSAGQSTLAGCANLPFVGPRLTLTLLNFDAAPHRLDLELLRAGGNERSESVVLHQEYELPPPDDGAASEVRRVDAVESRKLVVRAHLNDDRSVRADYLFYPDCAGERPGDELLVEIRREGADEEPYIAFQQTGCGSDSWWH